MYLIVDVTSDIVGFIYIEGYNFIITPHINEASKFKDDTEAVGLVLAKVRETFTDKQFIVVQVNPVIFGKRPRRIVNEEDILADEYYKCSDY